MFKHNTLIFYILSLCVFLSHNSAYADENTLNNKSVSSILNMYEQAITSGDQQQSILCLEALIKRGKNGVSDIVLWLKENVGQRDRKAIEGVFKSLASMGKAAKAALPYLREVEIFDMNGFRIVATEARKNIEFYDTCGFSQLPGNSKVYYLGKEDPDFGSPSSYYYERKEVRHVDIIITDTSAPVFLILTAGDPTIWRIGTIADVHIAAVYISGSKAQAITGITSDIPYRIISIDQGGFPCPYLSFKKHEFVSDSTNQFINSAFFAVTGQSLEPEVVVRSGEYYFAGPINNDISPVVYSEDLTLNDFADYTKNPFGLLSVQELIDQGSLRKVTNAEIDEWKSQYASIADQFDVILNSAYVVTGDIEYPAGLTLLNAQTFLVPPGVNPPVGDPGHSRVFILDQLLKSDVVDTAGSGKFLKEEEESSKKGDSLYTSNCSHCHMSSGMGLPGVFPPLAGSPYVLDNEYRLASIMLYGLMGKITVLGVEYNSVMAPHNYLSNEELSSIANYIRTTWGNDAPSISPDIFQKVRDKYGSRSMFNIEELENNQ